MVGGKAKGELATHKNKRPRPPSMAARGIKSRPLWPLTDFPNFLPDISFHYLGQVGVIIHAWNRPASGIGHY
jgi:hypothetical protein